MLPRLEEYVTAKKDVYLRKINIDTWKTEVTKQYKVSSIPNIRVFGEGTIGLGMVSHGVLSCSSINWNSVDWPCMTLIRYRTEGERRVRINSTSLETSS